MQARLYLKPFPNIQIADHRVKCLAGGIHLIACMEKPQHQLTRKAIPKNAMLLSGRARLSVAKAVG